MRTSYFRKLFLSSLVSTPIIHNLLTDITDYPQVIINPAPVISL